MTNELPRLSVHVDKNGMEFVEWGQVERDAVVAMFDKYQGYIDTEWGSDEKHKGFNFIERGKYAGGVEVALKGDGDFAIGSIKRLRDEIIAYIQSTFGNQLPGVEFTTSYARRVSIISFYPLQFNRVEANDNTVENIIEHIIINTDIDQYEVSEERVTICIEAILYAQGGDVDRASKYIYITDGQRREIIKKANLKLRERYCRKLAEYDRRTIRQVEIVRDSSGKRAAKITVGAFMPSKASDTALTIYYFTNLSVAYKFVLEWFSASCPASIGLSSAAGPIATAIADEMEQDIDDLVYNEEVDAAIKRGAQNEHD